MLNGGLLLEDRECFFIILLVAYFTSSFRQDRSRIADSSSSSSDLGMDSDETYEPVLESDVSEIRVTCYCHHDPLPGRLREGRRRKGENGVRWQLIYTYIISSRTFLFPNLLLLFFSSLESGETDDTVLQRSNSFIIPIQCFTHDREPTFNKSWKIIKSFQL